jgi:dipeptidyl aminopeptidase/acylaminoacyl peptidase
VKTKEEAFRKLEGFKLDGVVQKMKCPYLLVHGEGDQQAPFGHARKTVDAAGSQQKELKIFTREEGGYHHCQVDNVSIGTAYMWDWVADVLHARR